MLIGHYVCIMLSSTHFQDVIFIEGKIADGTCLQCWFYDESVSSAIVFEIKFCYNSVFDFTGILLLSVADSLLCLMGK